jgi:hypothetical protein
MVCDPPDHRFCARAEPPLCPRAKKKDLRGGFAAPASPLSGMIWIFKVP